MNEPLLDLREKALLAVINDVRTRTDGLQYETLELCMAALSQQPTLEPAPETLRYMLAGPGHPTERSGKRPEAAIEDRAKVAKGQFMRGYTTAEIAARLDRFMADWIATETQRSSNADGSDEKREVGKPESL